MRRPLAILLLLTLGLSMTSCDLFRKLASRPTSKDIEVKRLQIEVALAKRRSDSLLRVKIFTDSLEQKRLEDSLSTSPWLQKRVLSPLQDLPCRYYVIVGAFASETNSTKLICSTERQGYKAVPIKYKSGYTAVGICQTDSLTRAFASMEEVRVGVCPDAWILDTR